MRKTIILALAAMFTCGAALFTSCSDDDTNSYTYIFGNGSAGEDPTASKVLTLNITADGANTEVAKTDLTDGGNGIKPAPRRVTALTTSPTVAQEATINSLTIGVFGADGNVKVIKEIRTGLGSTTAEVTVKSNRLATTDNVLVAANIPSGMFAGCLTAADFKSRSLTTDQSLAWLNNSAANEEQPSNLPMYAEISGLQNPSANTFKASGVLIHSIAKVSLLSLETAFDVNGAYNEASFTPQQVFLWNVPSSLKIGGAAATGLSFYHGWTGRTDLFKEYLGTGEFKSSAIGFVGNTTVSSWGKKYYFYTMPNADTDSDTRLVIAGLFKKNADDKGKIEYYPVRFSKGTSLKSLANTDYQISVVLKGEGADDPGDIIDPSSLIVNLTVKNFTGQTVNAEYE